MAPPTNTGPYSSTTKRTSRFTTGNTSKSTGKATTQESPHAEDHTLKKSWLKPRVRKTLVAETTHVMNNDNKSGITIGAYRLGSFLIGMKALLITIHKTSAAR